MPVSISESAALNMPADDNEVITRGVRIHRVHIATTRSGSRTRDSGVGGGRSNKERQRLQPLPSVARAPLFEVRRVRFYTQPLLA